ncbi:hypothetical protein CEK71_10005 [Methylovulum psychrotolerans]|uniref:Effector-associated domain-containing protein n=1 Tax=Methylovulum psychrotolerans TaxID=1704499 RepID=A0A1Z4BYQ2_9GAMM|nr:hypothetical protein CEK71_10005 [Methylovulum psychrotolerans]
MLEKLSPNRAEIWWQDAVQNALSEGLANPDKRWAKAALHWLSLANCTQVLKVILPATEKLETGLLAATSNVALSDAELQQIRAQTIERGWSCLHAWTTENLFSAHDAFQAQRIFTGDPLPGLAYLVEHLSGLAVIEEAIANPNQQFISLVAQRTAKEPELLQGLDVVHSAWRKLWAAHVSAGGILWPANANQEILGNELLDAVLAGDEPLALIAKLAVDLAELVFYHPRRAELWGKLSVDGSTALLPNVADILIGQCNAGQTVAMPEPKLLTAVVSKARKNRPSVKLFAALLSWRVSLDEQEVVTWLSCYSGRDWDTATATVIGKAVSSNRWKRAADKLFDLYKRNKTYELGLAVDSCQDLLSILQSIWLSFNHVSRSPSHLDRDRLIRVVADLGANIAPDELDSIWERAGGKKKQLTSGGTPTVRWQEAASMANQGALKNGLGDLVKELREIRVHNPDLQAIEQLINQYSQKTTK